MTSDQHQHQQEPDDANATLADHALRASNPRKNPWPIAIAVVATVLMLAAGASALFQRANMEAEIVRLAKDLIASNNDVERLVAENAALTRKLDNLVDGSESFSPVIESKSSARSDLVDPHIEDATEVTAAASEGAYDKKSVTTKDLHNTAKIQPITATSIDDSWDERGAPPSVTDRTDGPEMISSVSKMDPRTRSEEASNKIGAWTVVVGAFSSKNNLNNLVSALENEGYAVTIQSITREGQELQQVKVIGFKTRSDATTAASGIELAYRTGKLRVIANPMVAGNPSMSETMPEAPSSNSSTFPRRTKSASPSSTTSNAKGSAALSENTAPSPARWFIFIDAFTDNDMANEVAEGLMIKGYNAKVAVEYSEGTLLYLVQIVGIAKEQDGQEIVQALIADNQFQRVQLRAY